MKYPFIRIAAISCIIISALLRSSILFGQWEPEMRLTNAPGISYPSYNNAKNLAVNGDTIHAVWFDNRSGYYEIYYKRSIDGGMSWGADSRLTTGFGSASLYPSIAVSGNIVHVVWHSDRDGGYELYNKRSADGGSTWEPDKRLTNAPLFSGYPSIAVSGNMVHVTWYDERDGNYEIYYNRSTDGGLSWGTDTRLTNNPGYSWSSSIAVSGDLVHIVWFNNLFGNEEIFYRRSSDGGLTWEEEIRLTNDPAYSDNTSVAVSGNDVHVVWMDNRDGNWEIYHIRSADGGLNWESETRLTFFEGSSFNPSIACSGLNLHCVWYDSHDGNYEIYYKRSTDRGTTWEEDVRLTDDPASSGFPFVAISDTLVHVLWQDDRDGNPEIYYKRNLNGNPVTGIRSLSTDPASSFSIGQNHPNPCSSTTKIKFQVAGTGNTNITLYDVFGKEVVTLLNKILNPGSYEITFDVSGFTPGIYYYCLQTDNFTETKTMILIK